MNATTDGLSAPRLRTRICDMLKIRHPVILGGERAILFYGQDAGLIDAIEPAGDIVARMVHEAHEVIARQSSGLLEPAAGRREV